MDGSRPPHFAITSGQNTSTCEPRSVTSNLVLHWPDQPRCPGPTALWSSCFPQISCLVLVLVSITLGFPVWLFDSLKNGLTEGVPVLVNWWRLRSFISNICGFDQGAQHTFYMCSHGELIRAFPTNSSQEIFRETWLYHFLGPRFFLQIPYLYCHIIAHCDKQVRRPKGGVGPLGSRVFF